MAARRGPPKKVNLTAAFASFAERWSPKIAGEVNDTLIKLVKLQGDFVWHKHDVEDELFLVTKGRMIMRLRDGDVTVDAGEFIVIPAGVEHCPSAEDECEVVLIEPASTVNTGDAEDARTRRVLDRIA
ncbi:MAG: cupin domain-containing protein [Myxococcales bacterium]|nr:cupin domain-containing protein [Myxococcales bacterium]